MGLDFVLSKFIRQQLCARLCFDELNQMILPDSDDVIEIKLAGFLFARALEDRIVIPASLGVEHAPVVLLILRVEHLRAAAADGEIDRVALLLMQSLFQGLCINRF